MKELFRFFGIFAGMNERIVSVDGAVSVVEMHRIRKDKSIEDISLNAGISPQYYRLIRSGKAPNVAFSVVMRLLRAVDVDILLFFPANKPNI